MIVSPHKIPARRAGHPDVWYSTLRNPLASLEDKEEARRQLQVLADSGDRAAGETLSQIHSRPTSLYAMVVTQHLGRRDFSEVTMAELLDHVPNVGIRTELILELRERLTC